MDAAASTLTTPLSPGGPSVPSVAGREGLAWLVRLRWVALLSVLIGALLGPRLFGVEVNGPVLLGAVAAGVLYNSIFQIALRVRPAWVRAPLRHALFDFGVLTLVLWASGGVQNPFISLYLVHVLLVSTLAGARAALIASAVALGCAGLLVLAGSFQTLRITHFVPAAPYAAILDALAFVTTLGASAYVARRAAIELAARRAEAEAARRAARRDSDILLAALDRLEVGVEVVGPDQVPRFQNRHLRAAAHDPHDCWRTSSHCVPAEGRCPVEEAREGRASSCRFSRRNHDGRERVIDLLSFPLSDARPCPVLRLHIDCTESFLAERKLLFAERLSSLGRTVQTVAHELNTPLATIQTLAADMRAAVAGLPAGSAPVARDLDESLALMLDELRRCRGITHELLGGRDLLAGASASQGPCDLEPAIRRAATLVFAVERARRLELDSSLGALSAAIGHDSLVQVFVNLLQNAADAIEGKPEGRIRVAAATAPAGRVAVEVEDNGTGLGPDVRARLFEAFFTTKPQGKGTGLGLYTAQSLVREAGGSLTLENRPEGGARARLELPAGGAR